MNNQPAQTIFISVSPVNSCNMLQFSVLKIRIKIIQEKVAPDKLPKVSIRTNLNQASRIHKQVIAKIEKQQSYSTDFYDIQARYLKKSEEYAIDLVLNEVGYFQFKVRAESSDPDNLWDKWSDGPNTGISVTPLPYGKDNSIYCAFIRQFGDNKDQVSLVNPELEKTITQLEEQGATVLPPGGNFQNFMKELPFIIDELGMKIIHLLPINPTPTSYGRMGMYGSPYATTDYFGIEHSYAYFSQYQTIEDQFIDLTSTIHGLGAKVFLDMVINHTGWASSINFTHKHWHKVDENRKIISPGAWDVIWGDLVELDYTQKDLWQYMADVFICWCKRGIDGFRLDAGYMVPTEVWQYIIAKVRQQFPNTLFLLEGLGGPWETTEELLTFGQMNWAYSELFQNYTKDQITDYIDYAQTISGTKGVMVNYAETHDNDRLAKKGKVYTNMRLHLCALTSFSGAWGFTNGVEWLATEKIDVHRNSGLNWNNKNNLVSQIAVLNKVLRENPAFWQRDNICMVDLEDDNIFAFYRSSPDQKNIILCLINLNIDKPIQYYWALNDCDLGNHIKSQCYFEDIFNEKRFKTPKKACLEGELFPGQCLLYRINQPSIETTPPVEAIFDVDYDKITLLYNILLAKFRPDEAGRIDQQKLLYQVNDYMKFIDLVDSHTIEELLSLDFAEAIETIDEVTVIQHCGIWTFKKSNRDFIISGDKWLIAHTFVPCTATLTRGAKVITTESIPSPDGLGHLSFFKPASGSHQSQLTFNWKLQRNRMIKRQWQGESYTITTVPSGKLTPKFGKHYPFLIDKKALHTTHSRIILTNVIGAMVQVPALPGEINSKYDTLLAIAPLPANPTNRFSLVKTVKETVQIGNKLFDLDASFMTHFTRYPHPTWVFHYDDETMCITIERSLVIDHTSNTLHVIYKVLDTNCPIKITTQFYIEYRLIHDVLQMTEVLAHDYKVSTLPHEKKEGFVFSRGDDLTLSGTCEIGTFTMSPHCLYSQALEEDQERGLKENTDLYNPGFFSFQFNQTSDTERITLSSDKLDVSTTSYKKTVKTETERIASLTNPVIHAEAKCDPAIKMLTEALDQFVFKSNNKWSIIAGIPWLSSLTRDNLHATGGLLAAGRDEVVYDILLNAAATEHEGLLNETLTGQSVPAGQIENPLRLITSVKAYIEATGNDKILSQQAQNNRSLIDVITTIFETFTTRISDTKQICVDNVTGFLYAPPCHSWMNTQKPAATPRPGYPIEIQALWYQALGALSTLVPELKERTTILSKNIEENFIPHFWDKDQYYLIDLLHWQHNLPCNQATATNGLRSNQLAAINANLVSPKIAFQAIKNISEYLVIPGGVRTLAEEQLNAPLNVLNEHGHPLVDAFMPYQGQCTGNETERRVAYHNGTAWSWIYSDFIQARAFSDGNTTLAINQSLAFFEALWAKFDKGAIGTLSEMLDGDAPHAPRGCFAHAVSIAEALRVYMHLRYTLLPESIKTQKKEKINLSISKEVQ